ncbi:MAG: hypothetical protein ACM3OB_01610 [Acidobacteriota bacterium]
MRKRIRLCVTATLAGALLAAASPANAAGTLYSVLHDNSTLAERLVSVDPATAVLTALGAGVSACCGVGSATTIDPTGHVFYFVGTTTADPSTPRLFQFDTQTGAQLPSSGVALSSSNSYNFIEFSGGSLYGLVRPGLTSTEQLVTINPTTGALTNIGSAISNCCSLQSASSALGNGQLYFVGSLTTDAVGVVRLFAIGLATGAITSNPTLDSSNSYIHLGFDPDTNTVYAMLHDTSPAEKVASIDPSTGTLTLIGSATANCCSTSGTAAYDPTSNVFYLTGGFSTDSGAIRLLGFSTATGANVSSPLWPTGNNYNLLEFAPAPAAAPSVTGNKTVSGSFHEGGTVVYSVTLNNGGTAAQGDNPGNEFTDTLPADLTLTSATATSGIATTVANTVTWNGTIGVGGSVTLTIQATVNVGTLGHTISNQGGIAFDSDGNGTNDAAAVTDDPSIAGAADPTSFVVAALPVSAIPTLSTTALALLALLLTGAALNALPHRLRR